MAVSTLTDIIDRWRRNGEELDAIGARYRSAGRRPPPAFVDLVKEWRAQGAQFGLLGDGLDFAFVPLLWLLVAGGAVATAASAIRVHGAQVSREAELLAALQAGEITLEELRALTGQGQEKPELERWLGVTPGQLGGLILAGLAVPSLIRSGRSWGRK